MVHDVVSPQTGRRVVRLHCSGAFDHGGHLIRDYGAKALRETRADTVLLDIMHLHYTWGDDLLLAFDIPFYADEHRADLPLAVVVGPDCQPAVQTLLEQEAGFSDWRDATFVFTDEPSALEWLCRDATSNA